ncbi:translation initiation factor IF-2-like [Meles meles]|uniref:translation initiation factor IF-2-like n=1 Tax=Meles meles TaxID=9662 RepID=UPI001E69A280|nr:translation initiation factor IF-2-like [Meles meles]
MRPCLRGTAGFPIPPPSTQAALIRSPPAAARVLPHLPALRPRGWGLTLSLLHAWAPREAGQCRRLQRGGPGRLRGTGGRAEGAHTEEPARGPSAAARLSPPRAPSVTAPTAATPARSFLPGLTKPPGGRGGERRRARGQPRPRFPRTFTHQDPCRPVLEVPASATNRRPFRSGAAVGPPTPPSWPESSRPGAPGAPP